MSDVTADSMHEDDMIKVSDSFKKKLDKLMNDPSSSKMAFIISIVINTLILLSSTTFCVETLPYLYDDDSAKKVSARLLTGSLRMQSL